MDRRIDDDAVLWLLKLLLDASGKQGVPQGGVITPPTMWQTAGFQVRARWAWCVRFHAKNYLHGLRAYFYALDQSANQLPPPGPVGLLQTGCNTLGKLF